MFTDGQRYSIAIWMVRIINSFPTDYCDPFYMMAMKTVGQKPIILNTFLQKNKLGYWVTLKSISPSGFTYKTSRLTFTQLIKYLLKAFLETCSF